MATVIAISLAVGESPHVNDGPFLLDNDKFSIKNTFLGGGSTRFNRKKTAHSEIITPLGDDARTLTIVGEYSAADHVFNGKFRYPFGKLARWKNEKHKVLLEWPGANNPWGYEVIYAPDSSLNVPEGTSIIGTASFRWFLQDITPNFIEYHSSTPQVVTFSIKLIEATTGLARFRVR